jgi:hypothetical protein
VTGAFQRLADTGRSKIEIIIDGDKVQVLEGDTLLTAILLHHDYLRLSEIGEEPRAGFCLMGACQDCWVSDGDGRRLRACTTYVRPDLAIITGGNHRPIGKVPIAIGDDAAPATAPEADSSATDENSA